MWWNIKKTLSNQRANPCRLTPGQRQQTIDKNKTGMWNFEFLFQCVSCTFMCFLSFLFVFLCFFLLWCENFWRIQNKKSSLAEASWKLNFIQLPVKLSVLVNSTPLTLRSWTTACQLIGGLCETAGIQWNRKWNQIKQNNTNDERDWGGTVVTWTDDIATLPAAQPPTGFNDIMRCGQGRGLYSLCCRRDAVCWPCRCSSCCEVAGRPRPLPVGWKARWRTRRASTSTTPDCRLMWGGAELPAGAGAGTWLRPCSSAHGQREHLWRNLRLMMSSNHATLMRATGSTVSNTLSSIFSSTEQYSYLQWFHGVWGPGWRCKAGRCECPSL